MRGPVPLVRVVRSGVEESVHLGSIAVADADGRPVASAGDPGRVAFARSATKPLQAAVSLRLAGEDLEDREIAVMCGSHGGERVHLDAVRAILHRCGLGFGALRCPPALPLDAEAARSAPGPRPEYHNCSGKHAGMLLACVRAGLEPGAYLEGEHPLQKEVLDAVGRAAGAAPAAVGIDGCGVPVHALPLTGLATMYARLVDAARLGPLGEAAARAVAAMLGEPYLVAGRGRLCTVLMEAVPGLVVKVGAEGLLCAAVAGSGLGVALKVEDGASRARGPAIVRALGSLGVLAPDTERGLAGVARPPVLGGGRPAGEIEPVFELAGP